MLRLLVFIFVFFLWVIPSYADQLSFNKSSINGTTSFYYKWRNPSGKIKELSFKLPTKYLRSATNSFKPFDTRISNDYVYKKMKEYTKKHNNNFRNVKVKRVRTGFELEARGASQQEVQRAINELKDVSKDAMNEYVHNNYYKYIDEKSIRPDHARIARKYVSSMRPVAQAIANEVNSSDLRDRANFALSFIQAIPYDVLKSRYFSNGAGFRMPYGLLMGNKGDCDTKSVAFASILRSFYPKLRMLMIYIPNHAFIGLALKPKAGDKYITIDGTPFVLAEPVGPRQSYIGKIADNSLAKLQKSDYSYEEI